MSVQQSFNQADFDPASIVKLYVDAIENWKKNYEIITRTMAESAGPAANESQGKEAPLAELQSLGSQLFRKIVETEVELCRFSEKRWSQYLKLPEAIESCKSPTELAQLQTDFCSRFTTDYSNEGSKLFGSFNELMSHSGAGNR